ncbi:MAG: Hsp70 family protein, partial [Gemmataceae bacterium]
MTTPRLRRTLGIDLGTTNCVIACLDDASGSLLTGHDAAGRRTLPSVVAWDDANADLAAGHDARALPGDKLPLSSVKRYMGLDRAFDLGPRSLTAPQVSAVLLRALRAWMGRVLPDNHLLDSAVVTMPAYFDHGQIEATRLAGEQAGYEVRELLHEPTAAAIYYSWLENHGDATYLVYDLGGGTFDVSVIRRRLGDHEVLAVSGDPFLGGDDFDRALASHLVRAGTWKDEHGAAVDAEALLGPATAGFARLVRVAESMKMELSAHDRVERFVPRLPAAAGRVLALEAAVTRADFQRLVRDKVSRTVDCCHEALGRSGLRLGDIDHVILVGGSSRVPLVRQVVQEAFANPALGQRVRNPEPLCHEPDLCVAYGAALRAAGHGTRYLFPVGGGTLELHVTSPAAAAEPAYTATGVVRTDTTLALDGGSVRVRSGATGLVEEAFLDGRGAFGQPIDLAPDGDTALDWTVCDADGTDRATVRTVVRCRAAGRTLGQGVLPTQLITRPLAIEVLTRGRMRVKQVVAPVGAALPGSFRCTCRTADQSGRVVVPVFEDNRVIKQLVIDDLDRSLPVGSAVEVEFRIDATHRIEVAVKLREGRTDRVETATIEPPPPPTRPTRADIDETMGELNGLIEQLAGRHRARLRSRAQQLHGDLLEALSYDDEAKAIARMAELRDLLAQAERVRSQVLDPPWPRFTGLVRHCLDLAASVSEQTGRDRDELAQHVHAQERYAEQANEEHNQSLYRECWDNLEKYA